MPNITYTTTDELATLTDENGKFCTIPTNSLQLIDNMLTEAQLPKFEDISKKEHFDFLCRFTFLIHVVIAFGIESGTCPLPPVYAIPFLMRTSKRIKQEAQSLGISDDSAHAVSQEFIKQLNTIYRDHNKNFPVITSSEVTWRNWKNITTKFSAL